MKTEKLYKVKIRINGEPYERTIPARMTLLQYISDECNLTGTKEGCGIGECGTCTVLFDGKAINSCMMFAVEADGHKIQTIEGEQKGEKLSKLQQAFIDHGAVQCGFCTPGMIMSARALLNKKKNPTDKEIIEAISGNLCRCTGYLPIIEAIRSECNRNL